MKSSSDVMRIDFNILKFAELDLRDWWKRCQLDNTTAVSTFFYSAILYTKLNILIEISRLIPFSLNIFSGWTASATNEVINSLAGCDVNRISVEQRCTTNNCDEANIGFQSTIKNQGHQNHQANINQSTQSTFGSSIQILSHLIARDSIPSGSSTTKKKSRDYHRHLTVHHIRNETK